MEVRHPEVTVTLIGEDGNAFHVIGRVAEEMRMANVPDIEVDQFIHEATQGDYQHLLRTVLAWVEVM